jgi:hypothetical protein
MLQEYINRLEANRITLISEIEELYKFDLQTSNARFNKLIFYTDILIKYSMMSYNSAIQDDYTFSYLNLRRMIEAYSYIVLWVYFHISYKEFNENFFFKYVKDFKIDKKSKKGIPKIHHLIDCSELLNCFGNSFVKSNKDIKNSYKNISEEVLHIPKYKTGYTPLLKKVITFIEVEEHLKLNLLIMQNTCTLFNYVKKPLINPITFA